MVQRKEVAFDDSEVERFGKHLMLKEIGVKGQKRIKAAKVVVAGAGALGSPVIQYLAAAGVGTIKVIDFSEVSLENLQSQVLHGSRDIKRPKVASAKDKVKNVNKNIEFIAEKVQLDSSNILEQIDGYDLVVDCSDNYKARYLINDACALHGIPVVFGASCSARFTSSKARWAFSIWTAARATVANSRRPLRLGSFLPVPKVVRSVRFRALWGASRPMRRSN